MDLILSRLDNEKFLNLGNSQKHVGFVFALTSDFSSPIPRNLRLLENWIQSVPRHRS